MCVENLKKRKGSRVRSRGRQEEEKPIAERKRRRRCIVVFALPSFAGARFCSMLVFALEREKNSKRSIAHRPAARWR